MSACTSRWRAPRRHGRWPAIPDADAVVTFGGGSATGLGKAIALEIPLPILGVPTTYAGSEMTPIWGLTEGARKQTGRDPRVQPATVVYDPVLTLSLPPSIAGPSGMNALAHCAEALYAPGANPITSLMAEEGIRALATGLPQVVAAPDDLDARGAVLVGAYLAGASFGAAGSGVHHKICHVLGGAYDLPHAELHAVVLPHALALMAPLEPVALDRIAAAMGEPDVPGALFDLDRRLGIPKSLVEIGMEPDSLDEATDLVADATATGPGGVTRDSIKNSWPTPSMGAGLRSSGRPSESHHRPVSSRREADSQPASRGGGAVMARATSARRGWRATLTRRSAGSSGRSPLAAFGAVALAFTLVGCAGTPAASSPAASTSTVAPPTGAATSAAPAESTATGRTLKIGYVSPKTGALASFAEADDYIIQGVTEAIGAGIVNDGTTYPVEIIQKDSQSDPNRAAEVANELILDDGVDMIVVASTPETTNPVSDVCEANGVPCVSSVAPWQPWFLGRQAAGRRRRTASRSNGPTISSGASRTSSRCSGTCGARSTTTRRSAS